jgi:nitronate monooxygenase
MSMRRFALNSLEHPIVQAPLGGGPSTPALAAAVTAAGGLGFLPAGYLTPGAVSEDIAALRERTGGPFGVSLFVPPPGAAEEAAVARYASTLRGEAERYGTEPGRPRRDDDGWSAKLELLAAERVPVVSFTFGCPPPDVLAGLCDAGVATWITVTTPAEAVAAQEAGADALVVQGVEAGGHRGSFDDTAPGEIGLLALLQLVRAAVRLPLVATGGIVTGRGVAAVLVAGASAAQLGTAFMRTPEAATSAPHRAALTGDAETALTRAFSGRLARGVVNRFLAEHGPDAPSAYPEVNHLTAPLRAAARERGDPDGVNLWAGQAYPLARELPAGELVQRLAAEARQALREVSSGLIGR